MTIKYGQNHENRKLKNIYGMCVWCGADIYCFEQRDEKGELESYTYYCSQKRKCGFFVTTADNIFISRLGRKITETEAKKIISKNSLILDCKKVSGDGTYKGEFFLVRRRAGYGKVLCRFVK